MPLNLDLILAKPISLKFHNDPYDAITGGNGFPSGALGGGNQTRIYIEQPSPMPTEASTGDLLLGSISYGQSKSNLIGSGKKPDGFPISMRVPPINKVKTKSSGSKNNKKDKKPETEKLAEAIRDLKVARLTKLHGEKNSENFDLIAKEILTVDPDYLPVLVEQLRRLDGETNRKKHLEEIITAADVVINKIYTET